MNIIKLENVLVPANVDCLQVRVVNLIVRDTIAAPIHHDPGSAHFIAAIEIVNPAIGHDVATGTERFLVSAA